MTGYLVHPSELVSRALNHIQGFKEMVIKESIDLDRVTDIAQEVAERWTLDWDEDEGFGSSDGTFMLMEFIEIVALSYGKNKYSTSFDPFLVLNKIA